MEEGSSCLFFKHAFSELLTAIKVGVGYKNLTKLKKRYKIGKERVLTYEGCTVIYVTKVCQSTLNEPIFSSNRLPERLWVLDLDRS